MYRCVTETDGDPLPGLVHALADGASEVLCHQPMSVENATDENFARARHLRRCSICVLMGQAALG